MPHELCASISVVISVCDRFLYSTHSTGLAGCISTPPAPHGHAHVADAVSATYHSKNSYTVHSTATQLSAHRGVTAQASKVHPNESRNAKAESPSPLPIQLDVCRSASRATASPRLSVSLDNYIALSLSRHSLPPRSVHPFAHLQLYTLVHSISNGQSKRPSAPGRVAARRGLSAVALLRA